MDKRIKEILFDSTLSSQVTGAFYSDRRRFLTFLWPSRNLHERMRFEFRELIDERYMRG